MTREEAIEIARLEIRSLKIAPEINGCEMTEDWQRWIDFYELAVAALREQAENISSRGRSGIKTKRRSGERYE